MPFLCGHAIGIPRSYDIPVLNLGAVIPWKAGRDSASRIGFIELERIARRVSARQGRRGWSRRAEFRQGKREHEAGHVRCRRSRH